MRTEDIAGAAPSDWRPEQDQLVLAVLGKLGEESSELASRIFRAVIQGLDAEDPDDGRTNREHIADEISDVKALVQLAEEYVDLPISSMQIRVHRKVAFKKPWLDAIEDERVKRSIAIRWATAGYKKGFVLAYADVPDHWRVKSGDL